MLVTTFVPNDDLPADHYNGVQQELDGLRGVLSALLSQYGYAGAAAGNAQVTQADTPSSTTVKVGGPARLLVPLNAPSLSGASPFTKAAAENITVPGLNTTAGQSRNDLVIARINVGQVNTYVYEVVQGTPNTTGSQVDPSIPDNSITLARITRAHGHGNILNADITDLRTPILVAATHQA